MIKFPHSIFALPFAVMSAFLAADGLPTTRQLFWIVVCMVSARSTAMAFNRLVDADIDALNPRTAGWALPRGLVSRGLVRVFILVSAASFVVGAGMLNRLALTLSPVALAIVCLYSYTKRFTSFSHLVLGLCLGIAPVGAWIGVRGDIGIPPILLCVAVVCWTAGFDILYSLQDLEFDRTQRLFSLPKSIGVRPALIVSSALHLLMVGILVWLGILVGCGLLFWVGVAVTAAALVYEHSLVRPGDLSRINVAFFNINGVISLTLMAMTVADVLID